MKGTVENIDYYMIERLALVVQRSYYFKDSGFCSTKWHFFGKKVLWAGFPSNEEVA